MRTPLPRLGRAAFRLVPVLALGGALATLAPRAPGAGPEAAPAPRSFEDAVRLSVDDLARLLKTPGAAKPEMFHVGFRVLFAQAHIPGSRFAGPGASPAGLE